MRIPIYPRKPNPKREWKRLRKQIVKEMMQFREMKTIFLQLPPVDAAKIQRRVAGEMKNRKPENTMCPSVARLFAEIQLTYKYALQITNTIVV